MDVEGQALLPVAVLEITIHPQRKHGQLIEVSQAI